MKNSHTRMDAEMTVHSIGASLDWLADNAGDLRPYISQGDFKPLARKLLQVKDLYPKEKSS